MDIDGGMQSNIYDSMALVSERSSSTHFAGRILQARQS